VPNRCPIGAPDQCQQALGLAVAALHRVRVEPQGEGRVGVPELGHHVVGVLPLGDQQRDGRVPELV
jgi:hypothetical protein